MRAIDPTTGVPLEDHPDHDDTQVSAKLDAARAAFERGSTFAERARLLARAADVLAAEREPLSRLMTSEMGKPIAQAEAEVDKCAWACRHFAEHGERYLAPERTATEAHASYVRCDPLGVLLAIMPWNFPLWQAFRAAAPALMAGNAVVLKHASNVPGSALAIERVFAEAGAPPGAFTTLLVDAKRAEALVEHPAIAAVTLTGSEAAGVAIARRAGGVLKKCVLELGGSDAFVVLEDADLDRAVANAVTSRLINNGQSCIAAKRFVVVEAIADDFERGFVARMAAARVGDPRDRATELGPLARDDLRDALRDQVERSVAAGARLATGGAKLDRAGWYFPPTVLTHVTPGMAAFDEETFGPVAAVARARDVEHAIALANASRYGLGASVWTRNLAQGEAVAARLEAGCVSVNEIVKSDPRLPFGGIKRSGYGRELAREGIREFVNPKSVWVADAPPPPSTAPSE